MYQNVIDFIKALYNGSSPVPLHAATFAGNEKKYLEQCIDTTFVSSVGEFVNSFEKMVADFTGAKRAVVCVNGTNAIHMALMLVGIERDDEVITQPLTFIATANAISYCGALPVFLDVDRDTMGLSPSKMGEWLQANAEIRGEECFNKMTGRRIKACVPMHTFGHPVRLDELIELCGQWHIELVKMLPRALAATIKGVIPVLSEKWAC